MSESASTVSDAARQPTGPLGILSLHHVSRTTTDLEASLGFYVDLLGFQPLRRPPFSFRGAWLYGYGLQIHLIEREADASPLPIEPRRDHIAFRVADIEAVIARFQAHDIQFVERVNAGGIRQIFIADPDGHQLEFAVVPEPTRGYEGPE